MAEIFIVIFVLSLISAVLGIQMQESVLSLRVKKALYLKQPYNQRLFTLSKFRTWWDFMPRLFILLLPLIFVFVLVLKFHYFLSELLDCTYCTSFHIMWIITYLTLGIPLVACFITAPLGILSVYFIEKVRR